MTERSLANAQAGARGLENELLAGQEVSIVDRLVGLYWAGKLDGNAAVVGIGTVAELRAIRSKMEHAVMLGHETARKITQRR